jgi:hypothetical protein
MNQTQQDPFEAELRRLAPARPPEEFLARLVAVRPLQAHARPRPEPVVREEASWVTVLLRWLVPAAAVTALVLFTWHEAFPHKGVSVPPSVSAETAPLRADDVKIDQQLVADFDAVARLPGGEPVRFRCQKWMDRVVLRDTDRGVVVQHQTPRVEVIPVRFETY